MDNKAFITKLSKASGLDSREVSALVDAFAGVLCEKAANLDSIAVPGFGTFVAMKEREEIVTDPVSGKRMMVPPRISVEFVAGTMLKKRLQNE